MTDSGTPLSTSAPGRYPALILGGCIVVMLASYLAMPSDLTPREDVGYMLRVTARLAFVLLLLAYYARPLQQLFRIGTPLVRNRRYLGLAMALAHTVHFVYVAVLIVVLDEPLEAFVAVLGGLAFVLMWLMALTSNNRSMRLLGPNWGRLHTVGLHYLWIVFMQSFAGRIGADDPYFLYAGLTLAGLFGLLLRVAAVWKSRSTGPMRAADTSAETAK